VVMADTAVVVILVEVMGEAEAVGSAAFISAVTTAASHTHFREEASMLVMLLRGTAASVTFNMPRCHRAASTAP
jgi:hypothetical protein